MKKIAVGKELNQVLGDTARNIFIFGLLVTIGLIIKV
jgi:1,4-dihydroxy-2-naphthoate octaprenyltransferase